MNTPQPDLKKEIARLNSFLELNPNPIFEVTAEGNVTFMNPQAQRTFPDLLTRGLQHSILVEWRAVVALMELENKTSHVRNVSCLDRTYDQHITRAPDSPYRIYLADITERLRVEKMKEEFIHNVNHELRTPLGILYESLSMLVEGMAGELNAGQKRCIDIAHKNAKHLWNMVEDLLEVTRSQTGKLSVEPARMQLEEIVNETVRSFEKSAKENEIHLTLEVAPSLPAVLADPKRVKQILINLMGNALKFTPQKGRINVVVRPSPKSNDFLEILVSDSGVGIGKQALERIFDRLYQTEKLVDASRKGLGIGLYICRQLVVMHGGDIWAESEEGQGTRFFFTLPVFSLEKLLAPVITQKGTVAATVAVLVVNVLAENSSLQPKTVRELMAEARKIIVGNLYPTDLVLPPLREEEVFPTITAVARTNDVGAHAAAKRIADHLENHQLFRIHELKPVLSVEVVQAQADTITSETIACIRKINRL